jgi:hypothetical protein
MQNAAEGKCAHHHEDIGHHKHSDHHGATLPQIRRRPCNNSLPFLGHIRARRNRRGGGRHGERIPNTPVFNHFSGAGRRLTQCFHNAAQKVPDSRHDWDRTCRGPAGRPGTRPGGAAGADGKGRREGQTGRADGRGRREGQTANRRRRCGARNGQRHRAQGSGLAVTDRPGCAICGSRPAAAGQAGGRGNIHGRHSRATFTGDIHGRRSEARSGMAVTGGGAEAPPGRAIRTCRPGCAAMKAWIGHAG